MKISELFYDKKPEDNAIYRDDKLGILNWVSKDNEWLGSSNGINIRLYYESNKIAPTKKLLDFAYSIVSDQGFLDLQLLEGKKHFSNCTLHLLWKIDDSKKTGTYQRLKASAEKLVYKDIFIQRQGRSHFYISCKLKSLIDGTLYELEFFDKGRVTLKFWEKAVLIDAISSIS